MSDNPFDVKMQEIYDGRKKAEAEAKALKEREEAKERMLQESGPQEALDHFTAIKNGVLASVERYPKSFKIRDNSDTAFMVNIEDRWELKCHVQQMNLGVYVLNPKGISMHHEGELARKFEFELTLDDGSWVWLKKDSIPVSKYTMIRDLFVQNPVDYKGVKGGILNIITDLLTTENR